MGLSKQICRCGTAPSARNAAFTIIEIMVTVSVLSICMAVVVPRLTSTKRQAIATTVGNDLMKFAAAFDVYAQERGQFPAETEAGVFPPEMAERINSQAWTRMTPMGGQYNWDNNQTHYGTRYRAIIQISATAAAPLPEDVEIWEALDRTIDDGNLSTGHFRLGAGNEPIYIIAQ